MCRDGRIRIYQLSENTAHRLNTQRKRGNIQQEDILYIARQNTTLDCSAYCHYLVRVYTLVRRFAEEFFYNLLDSRNTRTTSHQDHFINIAWIQVSILQSLPTGLESSLD